MLTKASVENILTKIMNYGARPLAEFNKFEALEMVENLRNISQEQKHPKHSYHRTVYHTLREKMSIRTDQFRALVLRLLGDKDHERVVDAVTKVEKQFQRRRQAGEQSRNFNQNRQNPYRRNAVRCFYCQRFGHMQLHCLQRKRDAELGTRPRAPEFGNDGKSNESK